MGQDQDPRDRAGIEPASDEDSSAEMQIISEVFGDQKPAAGDQVFSQDLFGAAPASPGPAAPAHPGETAEAIKPVAPAAADDLWAEPASSDSITIADAASVFGEPEDDIPMPPPPAPKSPEAAEAIKVVTDDDLRKLFDMSSPGFRPPGPAAAPLEEAAITPELPEPSVEPEAEPAAKPSWDEDTLGDQTAEVDLARPIPEPEPEPPSEPQPESSPRDTLSYFSNEGPPEPQPQPAPPEAAPSEVAPVFNRRTESDADISSDDIIDRLETSAVVGDMTAVAAGKKGSLLEQTQDLMSKLEPTGDDFLSVDELRKLFNNVNMIADLVCESAQRIDELERKLEKLEQDK